MTATNSTEPAKDGNGSAFDITFAAESVSGNKAQKTYIGEPVGETIITPAQDGTDGTGITAPAGAVGIRGWLSGIYNRLASIAVTGTFWQATQPISAASLPLPSGAATSAGVAAVNTTLGTPMQNSGGSVTANFGTLNGAATAAGLTTINTTLGTPMQNSGGSLTANAGTNLNTSLLALESGGNLANIAASVAAPIPAASPASTIIGSIFNISGTVSLPNGASTSANQVIPVAPGTVFSTQPGALVQGVVANVQPIYTNTNTQPASMNLGGGLRIGHTQYIDGVGLTVSTSPYTAGFCVGGKQTIQPGSQGGSIGLASLLCKSSQAAKNFVLYVFWSNPTSSTFSDFAAPVFNAADSSRFAGSISFTGGDVGLGGSSTVWNGVITNGRLPIFETTFYVVLVTVSAITFTTTSDLNLFLNVDL